MVHPAKAHPPKEASDMDTPNDGEALLPSSFPQPPSSRYLKLVGSVVVVAFMCSCLAFAISRNHGTTGLAGPGRLEDSVSASETEVEEVNTLVVSLNDNPCADSACGMSFAGGGYMAQSAYAGVFAGLMSVTGKSLSEFTGPFESIGGSSGGTWFATTLAYSSQYARIIKKTAKEPDKAGQIYNKSWVKPLLQLHPSNGLGERNLNETAKRCNVCAEMLASVLQAFEDGTITAAIVEQWDLYLDTLGFAQKQKMELMLSVAKGAVKRHAKKAGLSKEDIKQNMDDAREQIKMAQKAIKTCKRSKRLRKTCLKKAGKNAIDALLSASEQSEFPYFQDLAIGLGTAYNGGSTWFRMVANAFQKTANISLDTTLGSPPQHWAKGKTLIMSTSIPSPEQSSGKIGQMNVWVNQMVSDLNNWIKYSVTTTNKDYKKYRLYTPGRFSIVMGDSEGQEATSPATFCGTSDCFGFNQTYTGQYEEETWTASSAMAPAFKSAFEDSAGKLPVAFVAASSSAAFGGTAGARDTSGFSSECIDLATWVSSGASGAAWDEANDLKLGLKGGPGQEVDTPYTKEDVNTLAEKSLSALIDGGYTDGTAIAWQIAAGRTRIFALVNQAWTWFLLLFGSPSFGIGNMQTLNCEIFSTKWKDVNSTVSAFPELVLPPNMQWLTQIQYGQITTTTVANDWFGISAGVEVTIDVINIVAPHVSVAFFTNYFAYSALFAEVVQTITLPENEEAILGLLPALA